MKKFLIKVSIVFIFIFLLFRFTVVSLVNDYENKLTYFVSSSNFKEMKLELIKEIKKANTKDKILYKDDAETIGFFLRKILAELNLK
jgi:hypothetical protein